jgi:hypothetical protein
VRLSGTAAPGAIVAAAVAGATDEDLLGETLPSDESLP